MKTKLRIKAGMALARHIAQLYQRAAHAERQIDEWRARVVDLEREYLHLYPQLLTTEQERDLARSSADLWRDRFETAMRFVEADLADGVGDRARIDVPLPGI